jgi:transposase
MWKPEHRRYADRRGLRYPSDLTDAEWAVLSPMIPPAKRGGRPRDVNVREVLNAIFYVLSTGCQWKALPKDMPPKSTAHYYFMLWDWDRTLERIHHALYVAAREQSGREARPPISWTYRRCTGYGSGWSASAPASSIKSAPSCWSAALRCARDNGSCTPSQCSQ